MSRLPSLTTKMNSTATASARPSSAAAKKELSIPKSRSLSQPPHSSISEKEQPSRLLSFMPNDDSFQELHNTLLDCDLLMDHNLICDEFKDCLEGVKLELGCLSEFNSNLGEETAEEILNSLKLTEEMDIVNADRIEAKTTDPDNLKAGTSKQAKESKKVVSKLRRPSPNMSGKFPNNCTASSRLLSRKKSNSAIPISMSAMQKPATTKTKPNSAPVSSPPKQLQRFGSSKASSITSTGSKNPSISSQKQKFPSAIPGSSTNVDRLMEIFTFKKKRYDSLRKDLEGKQKPMRELYTALMELKKVLEESGKTVALIESTPYDIIATSRVIPDVDKGTTCEQESSTPVVLSELKHSVDEIRSNSIELCRKMINKRKELLFACQSIAENNNCSTCNHGAQLMLELEGHRKENAALEAFMHESIFNLDSTLREMLDKLTQMAHRSGDSECINALQDCKEYDNKIKTLERQLVNAQQDIKILETAKKANFDKVEVLQREKGVLTNKIAQMEKTMDGEKKRVAHEVDRYKIAETTVKSLRGKIRDLETQKAYNEEKVNHLNQEIKTVQAKMKQMERNFEREIQELNKARNVDKSVIEQMAKDKSSFEARLAKSHELLDKAIKKHDESEFVLKKELEIKRSTCDKQRELIEQIRFEMVNLKKENEILKTRPMQSTDLLKMKELINGRESELKKEVSALRREIKTLQEEVQGGDQIKTSMMDRNAKMDEASAKMRKELEILLTKKNDEITKIRFISQTMEDELTSNRAENERLRGELSTMRVYFDSLKQEASSERDFKCMIKEGRSKLEEALMKSVDNEHRMIKYEKELNFKKQYITKLETTLKSRENIIKTLHADVERVEMEKASMGTYSTEVQRHAKEELSEKIVAINALEEQLADHKDEVSKLLAHIHHLESVLMLANEKRFKLQDAVCLMDKELQSREVCHCRTGFTSGEFVAASRGPPERMHNVIKEGVPEPGSSYSDSASAPTEGMLSDDARAVNSFLGLRRWTAASASLYNDFKAQYLNNQAAAASRQQWPVAQALSSTSTLTQIEETSFHTISSLSEQNVKVLAEGQHDARFVVDSVVNYNTYQTVNPFEVQMRSNTFGGHSPAYNVDPAVGYQPSYSRIDHFNIAEAPSRHAMAEECAPSVSFPGVPDPNRDVWLSSSPVRSVNNAAAVISQDAFAHRCAQIKNNLECSMRRLNNARYPFQFAAASGQ